MAFILFQELVTGVVVMSTSDW